MCILISYYSRATVCSCLAFFQTINLSREILSITGRLEQRADFQVSRTSSKVQLDLVHTSSEASSVVQFSLEQSAFIVQSEEDGFFGSQQ